MHFFRGTKNIRPALLDHRKISNNFFGIGSYYALTFEAAERYGSGRLQVVTKYEIEPMNSLSISNHDIKNLDHFLPTDRLGCTADLQKQMNLKEPYFIADQICNLASVAGFDSILVRGRVEGGEQLIIPAQSPLQVTPLGFSVRFFIFNPDFASALVSYLKDEWNVGVENYHGYHSFYVDKNRLEDLESLLDFLERSDFGKDCLSYNFKMRTFEFYDE